MNPSNDCVIETCALSKRYGRKLALDHLDLAIPRGRIHAIVGANGAGKSTLFRILMGFLPPSSGEARILGRDSQALTPADRARIGFVNEEHTLPNWMRVSQVTTMQKHQYARWNQQAFDSVIGFGRLGIFHLNDSRTACGSRVDRHAHIGRGEIGLKPFGWILNDPRFAHLPKVIETPKEGGMDPKNLGMLRRAAARWKRPR